MYKSILLVDDEEMIRRSFSDDLNDEGFIVSTAASGEEAVEHLRACTFSLVVTDLMMEGINGLQVLKEAKAIDYYTGVIILTGFGDMNSAIEALRLGADDFLMKPCSTEELVIRINRCLEKLEAFRKIRIYEEMLPICCLCGDIRDDTGVEQGKGKWMKSAEFFIKKTGTTVTHTYCKSCFKKTMDES